MTEVYLVVAEHPDYTNLIMDICATRARAAERAQELVWEIDKALNMPRKVRDVALVDAVNGDWQWTDGHVTASVRILPRNILT